MANMRIHPALYIGETAGKGRGVFTNSGLDPMTTIEISSVLVLSASERMEVEKTALYNYIFEWGPGNEQCCVAWGYISMYNHSYQSNCEYYMDFDNMTMTVKTIRAVQEGEELTINYNGDWNDAKEVWFEAQ